MISEKLASFSFVDIIFFRVVLIYTDFGQSILSGNAFSELGSIGTSHLEHQRECPKTLTTLVFKQ